MLCSCLYVEDEHFLNIVLILWISFDKITANNTLRFPFTIQIGGGKSILNVIFTYLFKHILRMYMSMVIKVCTAKLTLCT